jgi:CRP-like cAMP-binding protein
MLSNLATHEKVKNLPAATGIYPAETELIQQHSLVNDIYFIEDGLIKLTSLDQTGHQINLGLRSQGWLLGAAAVLLQLPSPVAAATLTRCRLRRITAVTFLQLVKTDTQLSWHLHQMHGREVFEQIARMVEFGCLTARNRLAKLLHLLVHSSEAEPPKKGMFLRLPIKQREVAELIGVTPEHLSRLFAQLQRDGLLIRENGKIVIPDPEQLLTGSAQKVGHQLKTMVSSLIAATISSSYFDFLYEAVLMQAA